MIRFIGKWLRNIFYALDLFVNALTFGDPEETISSRIGKKQAKGKECWICKVLCKFLDKIDPRHCAQSINLSEGRGSDDDDSVIQRK